MVCSVTKKSKDLQTIIRYIQSSWPKESSLANEEERILYRRSVSLSVVEGCIMFGERLFIPKCFRSKILKSLHKGHHGIGRMKALARSYVYCPNIDADIENLVQNCNPCTLVRKSPIKNDLHSWPVPSSPWERLHVDYAGPFLGKYYFLVIDAFSKWPEIFETSSTTTTKTISFLRQYVSQDLGYL